MGRSLRRLAVRVASGFARKIRRSVKRRIVARTLLRRRAPWDDACAKSVVSLSDVHGLWRRTLIAWPDGTPDTTTEVYWLQGPSLYADLRVPAGRPLCKAACLRELDWPMLGFLARQEGFFGTLEVRSSIGHWRRNFDYQPDTGRQDRGHLAFDGRALIERGVEAPYTEHWSREPTGADAAALLLADDAAARIGCLIAIGHAFMFARGRGKALPPGADLAECLESTRSLTAAQDLFDCEISFGRVTDGDWRIQRSSLPFREGHTLKPGADRKRGMLSLDDVTPEGSFVRRAWRIARAEHAGAESPLQSFMPTP